MHGTNMKNVNYSNINVSVRNVTVQKEPESSVHSYYRLSKEVSHLSIPQIE